MPTQSVEIVVLTIIPEEYEAVVAVVENPQDWHSVRSESNRYAWKIGCIGSHSVAVGLVGKPCTTPTALAARDAYETFSPATIVLIGIAGGTSRDEQRVGDVMIAETIWYYEYGKVESEFAPRHNYRYHADDVLLRSAKAHNKVQQCGVRFGLAASGEKVIDNIDDSIARAVLSGEPKTLAFEMEGAGAAEAVQQINSRGGHVRFLMIRGISDMPPSGVAQPGTQTESRDHAKIPAARAAAGFFRSWVGGTSWPDAPPRPEPSVKDARQALERHTPTDDLFESFCNERFPAVAKAFSSGMTLLAKRTYLLKAVPARAVITALAAFVDEDGEMS